MATVMNVSGHAVPLTVGLLAPKQTRNVDTGLPLEASLLADGTLAIVDANAAPAIPNELASKRPSYPPIWTGPEGEFEVVARRPDGIYETVDIETLGIEAGDLGDIPERIEAIEDAKGQPNGTAPLDAQSRLPRSVRVEPTEINLWNLGIPMDGSSDAKPAIDAAKAEYSSGTLIPPPGVFKLPSGRLDLSGGTYGMKGQGVFASTFHAPNDADDALIVTSRAPVVIENMSFVGVHISTASNPGTIQRRGVIVRDNAVFRNNRVEGFGEGVVLEGNHQGVSENFIVNNRRNLTIDQDRAGYTTAQAPSYTHENQTLIRNVLTGCGEASLFISGRAKLSAGEILGNHVGFGPHGILLGAKVDQDIAIGAGEPMMGFSFEACGKSFITDLGYGTNNRRTIDGSRFYIARSGTLDPAYAGDGTIGQAMWKVGRVLDTEVDGFVGSSFNTTFGTVGTEAGFLFEEMRGFTFRNADLLYNTASAQNKPMFKMGGAALGFKDIFLTIFKQYEIAIMRAAENLAGEQLVQPWADGDLFDPNGNAGRVGFASGTRIAVGRVAAAGPLTSGNLIPLVVYGPGNLTPLQGSVAAGEALMVDPATPTNAKKHDGSARQVIGHALSGSAGGNVVSVLDRFPYRNVN